MQREIWECVASAGLLLYLRKTKTKAAVERPEPDVSSFAGLCELFPNGLYIPGYRPGDKVRMEELVPPEQLPRIQVPIPVMPRVEVQMPRVEVTLPPVPMPPSKWLLNPSQGQVNS